MDFKTAEILLVEDNPADIRLTQEALKEIKEDPKLRTIPVVILTVSKAEEDLLLSYQDHVNGYIRKPLDLKQFIDVVKSIETFWFTIVTLPSKI